MNIKDIKSLIQMMENSSLTLMEISENDLKIRLERTILKDENTVHRVSLVHEPPEHEEEEKTAPQPAEAKVVDINKAKLVKSPMVGIYYSANSPDAEPFVSVGSKVKKGDTLCIIEAMKVMNEITSEVDGEIVDISVQNGDLVEYNQVLFKVF